MKKSSKQVLILAIVLIICVMAYVGVRLITTYNAHKKEEAEKNSVITLGNLADADQITIFNGTDTVSFNYSADSDSWRISNDTSAKIDDSVLKNIATKSVGLTAEKKIDLTEGGESLSDYGIGDNSKKIIVQDSSGNVLSLTIGITNGGSCYAMLGSDETSVYLISGSLASYAGTQLTDILTIDSFPRVSEADIESIIISQDSKALTLTKEYDDETDPEKFTWMTNFENSDTPAASLVLKSGSKTPADFINELVSAISSLEFNSIAEYKGMDNKSNSYGLNNPQCTLTVKYTDPSDGAKSSFTLKIGNGIYDHETGNTSTPYMYYAVLDNSKTVNYLSSASVTPVLDLYSAFTAKTNPIISGEAKGQKTEPETYEKHTDDTTVQEAE